METESNGSEIVRVTPSVPESQARRQKELDRLVSEKIVRLDEKVREQWGNGTYGLHVSRSGSVLLSESGQVEAASEHVLITGDNSSYDQRLSDAATDRYVQKVEPQIVESRKPDEEGIKQDKEEAYIPRLRRLRLEAEAAGDFMGEAELWAEEAGYWAALVSKIPDQLNSTRALVAYQFARDTRANHGLSQSGLEEAFKNGAESTLNVLSTAGVDTKGVRVEPPTETVFIPNSRMTPQQAGEHHIDDYIEGKARISFDTISKPTSDSSRNSYDKSIVGFPPPSHVEYPDMGDSSQRSVSLDHPDDDSVKVFDRDSDGDLSLHSPYGLARDESGDLYFRRPSTRSGRDPRFSPVDFNHPEFRKP